MGRESYYWSRDTNRGRKEAFWSNGEVQLRVHGPMSHVNQVMGAVVAVYGEPSVPSGPPPKDANLPDLHPGQTNIIDALEEQEHAGQPR